MSSLLILSVGLLNEFLLRIYGGYRSRLGPYQVSVDNDKVLNFAGYQAGSQEDFNYLLCGIELDMGLHELQLTNISPDPARPTLDVDYVCDGFLSELPRA